MVMEGVARLWGHYVMLDMLGTISVRAHFCLFCLLGWRVCNVSMADVMTMPPLSESLVPVKVSSASGAGVPATDF